MATTRPSEQEAYRYLHQHGLYAFDQRYPYSGTDLINRWADQKIIRVSRHEGSVFVTTFEKYARCSACKGRPRYMYPQSPCPTCGR